MIKPSEVTLFRSTGHEYEIEMKRKLQSYNIPFHGW